MNALLSTFPESVRWKVYLLGREVTPDEPWLHLPDTGLPHPANRPAGGGP